MKTRAMFLRFGTLCIAIVCLVAGRSASLAQATSEIPPAKTSTPDDLSPAELLKSYLQVREQLHAAQLAIVNNRVEAESKARAQAAALTEKIEAIRVAIEAEREGQRAETQRANAERERQREEMQNSNRTILWIAVAVGAMGLMAMLIMPLVQWRAINRITEITALRAPLTAPDRQSLLPAGNTAALDQAVTLSSQRLLNVIDRMERRIFELEHTAVPATPAVAMTTTTNGVIDSETSRRAAAAADQAAWIAVLLAKGQSLLGANKAKEAIACFDEILKLDENHTETLVKKGVALERLKQDDAALRCYDRAIELDQKMTLAYLYKGGVCNRMKRYNEAVECYEEALKAEEAESRSAVRT